MTVNRNHDGNELRCDVDWLTDITGPAQTVNVAYGPDSASIPESPVFYTDSTGSHNLTLTCTPRDVNPTTGLTYRWTGRCAGVTSDRCSFRPRPPDENGDGDVGATVQCTVTNTYNNKMAQGSFTLQLKYPPRVTPTIQGYVDNTTLYQGDSLNINCTVAGGEPPVISVTLTCTGHSEGPSNGQSSSLSVTSLNASDHGAVCTCSASWVKPKYYTLTATRTLTVYCKEQTTKLNSAALAGGLVAAVIIIGLVAGTLIFIKRRSEGSKAAEHNQQAAPSSGTAERADRPSYDVYEIQEFPAQNNYELLRLQDVRVRSEYAGFTPCVNSGADVANDSDVDAGFSLYANTGKKAVKSSGPVYVNTIPLCNRIYENVRGNN
ncbi:uncharacterized protein [Littorina saxatilis]|uniref:uncharacterized protein n=1 Tax=Littorina saxatilis TaxID=31220 RepID=UPI0038B6868E